MAQTTHCASFGPDLVIVTFLSHYLFLEHELYLNKVVSNIET